MMHNFRVGGGSSFMLFWCSLVLGVTLSVTLTLESINNPITRNALCNDGSEAKFYLSEGTGTTWLIYLQGGGGCFDIPTCQHRNDSSLPWPQSVWSLYMTSSWYASESVLDQGIFAGPFAGENIVWMPYCSSDFWSGDRSASEMTGGFEFHGKAILMATLQTLWEDYLDFRDATRIVLAGSSAGGIGVYSNSENVLDFVQLNFGAVDTPELLVVADGAWFVDGNCIFSRYECLDSFFCDFPSHFMRGQYFWNLQPNSRCAVSPEYSNEPWKCLMGKYVYPYITPRKLVLMFQYDTIQTQFDGILTPKNQWSDTEELWVFVRGKEVHDSAIAAGVLSHGVFAPGMTDHTILDKAEYFTVATHDGATASSTLAAFLNGDEPNNHIDSCCDVACAKEKKKCTCFSLDSVVTVVKENGFRVTLPIRDLTVGVRIETIDERTLQKTTAEVMFIRDEEPRSDSILRVRYRSVDSGNEGVISLTSNHYVHVLMPNDVIGKKTAGKLHSDDVLLVVTPGSVEQARIVSVTEEFGSFEVANVYTKSQSLIVDGVFASMHTVGRWRTAWKILYTPLSWIFSWSRSVGLVTAGGWVETIVTRFLLSLFGGL